FTNITDLRARERELSDLVDKLAAARDEATHWRSRLTEAIEAGSEGFALYDHDDRLVLCNSYFRRLYHPYEESIREGVSFGELCDKSLKAIWLCSAPPVRKPGRGSGWRCIATHPFRSNTNSPTGVGWRSANAARKTAALLEYIPTSVNSNAAKRSCAKRSISKPRPPR